LSLSAGGDTAMLLPGETINITQSSVSLEELLGKFIFSVTDLVGAMKPAAGQPQGATPPGATPPGASPQGASPQGASPQGASPPGGTLPGAPSGAPKEEAAPK
jgi:phospholipid/cholesterol/gamma-HCH transport system substrate-binding protein